MASVARFYCPNVAEGEAALPPEEARHARAALRLRAGDEVVVFDGHGTQGRGRLACVSKDDVTVAVEQVVRVPFDHRIRLTVAVAMPRAHRQHVLIEKCTEIGVFAIQPLICERSVVQPRANSIPKWRRVAIEAAKQSQRAWVPHIEGPRPFAEAAAATGAFDLAVLLAPSRRAPALGALLARHPDCDTMVAWIGPEGGLTDEELDIAVRAGAAVARLGPATLRVETAAILTAGLVTVAADAR